jgi:hypothetical protein
MEREVEAAVLGEQLQHVVEEADAGGDFIPAAAFDAERAGDLRLFGVARWSAVLMGEYLFEIIDVVDDGVGVLFLKQEDQVEIEWVRRARRCR